MRSEKALARDSMDMQDRLAFLKSSVFIWACFCFIAFALVNIGQTTRKPDFVACDHVGRTDHAARMCSLNSVFAITIFSTLIKLPFVVKTFVLSIFEWPF